MIYFIQEIGTLAIKIGYTNKSAKGRLKELQTGNQCLLMLLGTTSGTKVGEKRIHDRYAKHHIRGEWYEPAPELIALIESRCGPVDVMRQFLPRQQNPEEKHRRRREQERRKKKASVIPALSWLAERFREKLEWPSDELFAAAERAGVTRDSVFAAKWELDTRAKKVGGPEDRWIWWVPPDWEYLAGDLPRQSQSQALDDAMRLMVI